MERFGHANRFNVYGGRIADSLLEVNGKGEVMKVEHLATRIQKLQPHWRAPEVAEMCLMLSVSDDEQIVNDDNSLSSKCSTLHLRRQHVTEQYGAVLEELDELANSDPSKFEREQIWVLLRAIKIQDQIIKLHLGGVPLDV